MSKLHPKYNDPHNFDLDNSCNLNHNDKVYPQISGAKKVNFFSLL